MTIRWGILGVAKINERLIPAFGRANNAELRAIASRSIEKAKAAAVAAKIPVAHGSYDALLADPTIDAVYIPLPNHLHAEWTLKAAQHGKHVLCEKPLTPTAAEAQQLVDACRAANVRLMDGFMWPHHPRTREIREFLDTGGLGDVLHVNTSFTFMLDLDPANIRLQSATAGGSLLDVGCYPIYGIRWVFGAEPESVWATASMRDGVDLRMSGVLQFSGGRTANFDCGFTLPFRGWMEIAGTKGTMRIPEMWLPSDPAVYEVERDDKRVERFEVSGQNQIAKMIENFGRAIIEKREASPSPDQAIRTLRVLDALAKSARDGRVIRLGDQ